MPKTLGLSLALLVMSSAAMAKQNLSTYHQTAPSVKVKSVSPAKARSAKKPSAAKRASAKRKKAVQRSRGTVRRTVSLPAADQYIGPLRVTGQGQAGRAAWYGTKHVGRRYRERDCCASLTAAAFAGAGHESRKRSLGGRAD
jgi:rare lipoprotein A (peptidoglycan hydrolase)